MPVVARLDETIEPDATPKGQDWPKRTWDFPNGVPRSLRGRGRQRPNWPELKDGESITPAERS